MSLPDGIIRERTRQYGVTDDPFMGIAGSFQYAENLNVFDDPRWIKLTTMWRASTDYSSCKFVSAGDYVVAIPTTWDVKKISPESRPTGATIWTLTEAMTPSDATVFAWFVNVIASNNDRLWVVYAYPLDKDINPLLNQKTFVPQDRTERWWSWVITMWEQTPNYCNCITNFNNSMMLVGNWNYLRAYNPADDTWATFIDPDYGEVHGDGWKIVKVYDVDTEIMDISPKADYVEIFLSDSAGNTKIHYYPWIFDMEDSGLMKSVNLPNTRIQRVYPHMTKEMIVITYDGSNNNVSLREVIGYETYPVMRSHRAWLSPYDIQHKLGFFTWPCSEDMARYEGRAYIADVEWIWEFNWYDANKMPVGTLRWKFNDEDDDKTPFWLAVAKDYIFVSYDDKAYCCRIFDTANPAWYVNEWMLISRAIETEFGWEFTKQLVRWIVQFEMNNLTDENGSIDVYVCWNREWNSPHDSCWVKIAHIEQSDADFSDSWETNNNLTQYNIGTCVHRFDNAGDWNFMQDRQVIEYKIVIHRWQEQNASPVLRSLLMEYDVKEKTNYF